MYMYAYEKTIGIEDDSIMFNNGRKNICVILCDVAGHYQEREKKAVSYTHLRAHET